MKRSSRVQIFYLVGIVISLLFFVAAYRNSLLQFWDVWRYRSNYSHGFLIGLVTLGLLWRAGKRTDFAAAQANMYFLVPLLGLSSIWLFARLIDVQVLEMGLFPLILASWILVLTGIRVGMNFVIPLLFLYFAVPFWEIFSPVLQTITVRVVEAQMALVGIPAFIEGNLVTLPTGRFEIASGCSGIGLMIVSLAMSSLFAYLNYDKFFKRAILVAAGAVFAMVINWIRVFIIILSGHLTEMQHYFVTVDHSSLGWVLFAIGLVPFLYVAGRFSDPALSSGEKDEARERLNPIAREPQRIKGIFAAALVATAVGFVAPIAEGRAADHSVRITSMRAIGFPVAEGGWRREPRKLPDWSPDFPAATISLANSYERGDQRADLQLRVYLQETQGKELINDMNEVFDTDAWQVVASEKITLSLASSPGQDVNRLVLRGKGKMLEIWYWYEIGGRSTSNSMSAKALQSLRLFTGRNDNAMIAVGIPCDAPCAQPSSVLRDLVGDMYQPLKSYFARIAAESSMPEKQP